MKKGRRSKLIIMAVALSLSVMFVVSQNTDVMAQTVKVSKVTKVKKSKVIDGFKFISKKNNYEGCYRKISWKKIKGIKGYQVYRYDYLLKKWEKVLTTKKNCFKVTSMLPGEKVKFRIRAYKKKNCIKYYGKYSKPVSYKEKALLAYNHMGKIITKNSYAEARDDYYKEASKQAFIIQNEYRKKAGKQPLVWDDDIYEVAKIRAKEQTEAYGHVRPDGTWSWTCFKEYLGQEKYNELGSMTCFSENVARGYDTPLEAMNGWYKSDGHRENFLDGEWNYGAIACYKGAYWVAEFSKSPLK